MNSRGSRGRSAKSKSAGKAFGIDFKGVEMMRTCQSLPRFVTTSLAILTTAVTTASADPPRLQVSSNGRFLVQENGAPFFWLADTNLRLYKLTRPEIDSYLNNRQAKGFNVIQGPVLLHNSEDIDFTNPFGQTNTNPANPNEQWFQHIDYIVDAAKSRNMYIALIAAWGDGWDNFNTNGQARNFGRWVGQRYANDSNVIWIAAGEYSILGTQKQFTNRWKSLALGLQEGSGGQSLITAHGSFVPGSQSSSVAYHKASWLDFNMIQSGQTGHDGSGSDNWNLVGDDYRKRPAKPTVDGEANLERFNGWTAFDVRRRAYWAVFAGAFGHTYSANGVWSSYRGGGDDTETGPQDTWDQALKYPGGADMKHLRRLMESRPMLNRVPDGGLLVSGDGGGSSHVQATRDGSGRYGMVYVPGSNREITVDLGKISGGQVRAWWFDPRTGKSKSAGNSPSGGSRTFTTPGSGQDWVLVLDDASQNFPAPAIGGPLP